MTRAHDTQSVNNNLHLRRYLNIVARQKQHRHQPTSGYRETTVACYDMSRRVGTMNYADHDKDLKLNDDAITAIAAEAVTSRLQAMPCAVLFGFVYLTATLIYGRT